MFILSLLITVASLALYPQVNAAQDTPPKEEPGTPTVSSEKEPRVKKNTESSKSEEAQRVIPPELVGIWSYAIAPSPGEGVGILFVISEDGRGMETSLWVQIPMKWTYSTQKATLTGYSGLINEPTVLAYNSGEKILTITKCGNNRMVGERFKRESETIPDKIKEMFAEPKKGAK